MRYVSAVDWWYYVVLGLTTLLVGISLLPPLLEGEISLLLAMGIWALVLALPIWLLLDTHYTVDGAELLIRSGPFSWRIPIAEIRSAACTRSVLSAPALSLDRIELVYGDDRRVLVSPRHANEFLEAIGHGG